LLDTGSCPPAASSSSHGLGLVDAIRLGRCLDELPSRLIVIGIVGADFAHGRRLSPPVAAVVEPAARLVRLIVERESRVSGSS
jgi:hydrogenase maturation protease